MKKCIYVLLIFTCLHGCVEPFEAGTETFENALVIAAFLTDEEKKHEIMLSRARPFEQDSSSVERNANVFVSDDTGVVYNFEEIEPGRYISQESFAAQSNKSYQLAIATQDGRSYVSESVNTPEKVGVGNLYAERGMNDFGEEGVKILLDNNSSGDEPKYFKYEYEETYKIIAPNWDPFEFEIIYYVACAPDRRSYEVGIKPRTEEQRVCFATRKSQEILQTSTAQLSSNVISGLQIRFIERENYIMSHRYSILVKQYAQTQDAHSYFENLSNFSSTESVFSDIQPGFLKGNISSKDNTDEKVLGYFEVASVTKRRVYFNYEDLFPGEPLPPYAINCNTAGNPPLIKRGYHCAGDFVCDGDCESPLIEAILAGIVVYRSENESPTIDNGPYFTLPSPCGDCTKLGSNIVPDFWVE